MGSKIYNKVILGRKFMLSTHVMTNIKTICHGQVLLFILDKTSRSMALKLILSKTSRSVLPCNVPALCLIVIYSLYGSK